MNEPRNEQGSECLLNFTRTDTSQIRMCCFFRFFLSSNRSCPEALVSLLIFIYTTHVYSCVYNAHCCTIIIFTLHHTLLYFIYLFFFFLLFVFFFLVYSFAYLVCVTLNCFTPLFLSRAFAFHHRRELCGLALAQTQIHTFTKT